ncbi:hypothetical protein KC726_00435 [Candidatus Woesebacteria bacterium]|nr:hypothetical protein [Candidatus Woesebacteria bacterium]
MSITQKIIKPSYARQSGLWVLHVHDIIQHIDFVVKETNVIYIPPGVAGGNHKHPRIEAFFAPEEGLELIFQEKGTIKKLPMKSDGNLCIFTIAPMVPHAVFNNSKKPLPLIEFADGPMQDVQKITLI